MSLHSTIRIKLMLYNIVITLYRDVFIAITWIGQAYSSIHYDSLG